MCTKDQHGSKLWVTRLENGKVVDGRYPPKSTGHQDQLYTLKDEPFSRAPSGDYVERAILGPIDADGATAMEILINEGPEAITAEQRRSWALFLSAMFERHVNEVRSNEQRARDLTDEIIREELASAPTEHHRQAVLDSIAAHDPRPFAENLARWNMVRGIQDEPFLEHVLKMGWLVARVANPRLSLVTSDSPLVVNAGAMRTPVQFAWIALSPTVLFMMLPASELLVPGGPVDEAFIQRKADELLRSIRSTDRVADARSGQA